ncbi:MAG: thiamine pyrophosphate-binding protein [Raoultibacter sp.]
MKKRIADIMMETLVNFGVTDCFGVVGGGAMHLDNALALNKNIHPYFNHNEQASAMAAEAYARVSGRCAAVCVTSGPGATNAITGVAGAWQDSIPLIVLSGQVRHDLSIDASGLPLRYRGPQEFDIIPSVKNMTKYAVRLTDPLSACYELEKAWFIAMEGRRGPVWVDVPLNIQSAQVEESELRHFDFAQQKAKSECSVEDIAFVKESLCSAQRPVILAGSGIVSAGQQEAFEKFVDLMGVPVVGGAHIGENFYNEHPNYFGLSGDVGPRAGNFILQNADVILVLANSLGFRQTGYMQEGFAPHAKIIMVDIDANEAAKPGLHVNRFVHADIKDFFAIMLESGESVAVDRGWLAYCEDLWKRFDLYEGARGHSEASERVSSYYFWKVYDELAPQDNILCLGCNSACTGKVQIGKRFKDQRIITNYTIGSLGSDLPYSIGAAVASKKPVTCVTGDGGIMFNLQELQTIRHYGLPVNVIMFSNGGYNAIRQTGKNFFNGVWIGCTPETGISFPAARDLAHTFGFEYRHCENNGEVAENLSYIFSAGHPVLLEVEQRYDDPVAPKLQSRMREDGTFESPVLHDMSPFLADDELASLMFWDK